MSKLCLVLTFLWLFVVSGTLAARTARTLRPPVAARPLNPEIVNELKDFQHLIPDVVLADIVAKHLFTDASFRKAAKYMDSPQYKQQLKDLQEIPEVMALLDFLHLTEPANDLQEVESNEAEDEGEPQVDFISLDAWSPRPRARPRHSRRRVVYNLRSFTSFVEEVLKHLPHDQFANMITEKCQRSAAFAKFYEALKSPKLRPMVEAVMQSPNLSGHIKRLNDNAIDVKSLEPIAFEVISWGPRTDIPSRLYVFLIL